MWNDLIKFYRWELTCVGIGAVLLSILLFFAYCGASSDSDTSKADKLARESANAHVQSVLDESNANVIHEKVTQKADEIQAAVNELDRVKRSVVEAENTLKKRKAEYEALRKKPVVISTDDLDARERKLLTKLRELQK